MAHRHVHRVKVTDGSDESYKRHGADARAADEEPQAELETEAEASCELDPAQETINQETDPSTAPAEGPDDLQRALEAEKERADQEHDRYLRALADFSNYKRRQEEQQASRRDFAARELILKVLNVMDDFERARQSAEEAHSFDALSEGLSLTIRKLHSILEAEGVKPIEAVGQPFDPMFHEAVMRVEDSEHPENTVVGELQKGYTMKDEVIRPAMVTVAVES